MSAARALRFGGLLIPNTDWATVLGRAQELERLGFDLVLMDDHLANPLQPAQPWFEVWTALSAIAAHTSRIRLGPLVSNCVLRHPALLARQALTVDHVSGGRLELGLGSGYAPTDHRFVQQPEWEPRQRATRFAESVATIDALLRGTAAPTGGTYIDVDDLVLAPVSPQRPRPPLVVAADGPTALDTAARFADTWVSFGGWGLSTDYAVAVTRQRSTVLDERCAAHGRDPSAVARMLLAGSAGVNRDPIWTSVDAFEDFVERFRAIGIDTFVFYFPPEVVSRTVDQDAVQRVVHEVLPRLRGH